ncbi:hypothetical protein [Dactylosporangium sp. NPDC048998]
MGSTGTPAEMALLASHLAAEDIQVTLHRHDNGTSADSGHQTAV